MAERLSPEALQRYQALKASEPQRGYTSGSYDLNLLFATKPLEFFRRYAVVPPSDTGGQTLQNQGNIWTDVNDVNTRAVTGGARGATAEVLWKRVANEQRIIRINFERVVSGNEKGAITFKAGQTGVPIYFLPWESLSLVSLAIPDTGGAFYDPDDPDFPGLFFTAAINGCSVFVKGSPHRPEIFHAGINGDFSASVDAVEFWRERLTTILRRQGPGGGHIGAVREVNKRDYIRDPRNSDPSTTATAMAYETWLKSNQAGEFRVQMVSPWACVFGIRYGRAWTFYLQENATVSLLRYVKKDQTEVVRVNDARTQRKMKGTGEAVTEESHKQKVFGPFSRTQTIYMMRQDASRPQVIREFYPSGGGSIKIKDEVRRI